MIRNLKVLGLALMAMCAFGALTASAASAQTTGQLTSDGPVTLTGTQLAGAPGNSFTAFSNGHTTCSGATYTGHKDITQHETKTDPTLEHEYIDVPTDVVTITPHYGLCSTTVTNPFHLTFRTTVDMNGCDYTFKLGETTPEDAENTYGVDAFVECPENKHIQITLFSSTSNHNENKSFCTITITHKKGEAYKGLHATDLTNGHINISGTIENIKADKGGSFPCPAKPGEEDPEAKLNINVTVAGHTVEGGKTDIGIWH